MKRFILFAGLYLAGSALLFAQNARIDSLLQKLQRENNPRHKADLLHSVASALWDYDFNKALSYARQSYELATSAKYQEGEVKALTDQGMYYYYTGDYKKSRQYYRQALQAAQQQSFGDYPAFTYVRLANLYRVQAAFDSAQYYYNKSLESLKDNSPGRAKASTFHNMGLLQHELSDHSKAKEYFQQALSIRLSLPDSNAIGESYKSLGMAYLGLDDFDSALFCFNKVHDLAIRDNNTELLIFYNIYKGQLHFKKGEFVEATQLLTIALDLLSKHPFKRYQALALKHIGQIFEWQGDYQRALEFFFNSLEIDEALNSRQEIARTYAMMGWVYANQKDFANAEYYSSRALKLFRAVKDDFGRSDYYALSGYIAFLQKKHERALMFYDSALAIRRWFDARIPMVNTLNLMAQVYTAQKRYEDAIKITDRVFEINAQVGNRAGIAAYYNNKCDISLLVKHFPEAEKFALQALDEGKAIRSAPEMRRALLNLSTVYSETKNYAKAIQFYDWYIQISDSLYNAEGLLRQTQLNAIYQLDKHEQQIATLHQENVLHQATLKAQQNQLRFQNTVLIFSIFGLITLSSLAYVLYTYNRSKNRANEELSRLHREVVEKNEEIQAQSEELIEANEILMKLNRQLTEKQEEIEAQSEELREANQIINEINHDLENIVTTRTSQLKEAYKELDTFFYRSSHDFRRPLTTFMGLAEVAKVTVKDQHALDLFDKVKETARNLDKMLVKLQSVSDVGAQHLVYKPVLIREIFDNVCDNFQEEIRQKGIKTQCDVNLHDSFISYPAMIKIIIENLVENAIQFCMPPHPFIQLRADQIHGMVMITVKDNGQGIAREYQNKIFDMYFRGSDRSKGNGLGLYIIKKAVEKLGGSLELSSEIGVGSTFNILLPMHDTALVKTV